MNQDSVENTNSLVPIQSLQVEVQPTYAEKTERINAVMTNL